jgi:putative heme-binding domain-containing protein
LFPVLWASAGLTVLDESNFITVSMMLRNRKVNDIVVPLMNYPAQAERYVGYALNNQQLVQSPEMAALLKSPAEELLRSDNPDQRHLALDAIGRFAISTPVETIMSLVNEQATDQTVNLVISILQQDPARNASELAGLAENKQISPALRISALHSLAVSNSGQALKILESILPSLDDEQKKNMVSALSSSGHGARILMALFDKKTIGVDAFTLTAAERVADAMKENASAAQILTGVRERIDEEKRQFNARLEKYVAIAEQGNGDVKKGEVLFQTCLMCHRVGEKGQDIAPALDGSAARESEALFTALLDPDAAVERGYEVFRVTRKDNTTVEGYLRHRDGVGTTLALIGGSEVFIPIGEIKGQQSLGGRSFMPRGLIDDFTDQQVADLVAYVRTLK